MSRKAIDVQTDTTNVIEIKTGVAIPEATKKSMAKLGSVATGLKALKRKYAKVPNFKTEAGYQLAKTQQADIASVRRDVMAAHKTGKAFYLEGGRKVDAMKRDILAAITPLEDVRKAGIKAIDDAAALLAAEKAEAETLRITRIEQAMATIQTHLQSITLDTVTLSISVLQGTAFDAFEEFEGIARENVAEVLAALTKRQATLQAQEDLAQQLENKRIELENVAAKQAADMADFTRLQNAASDKVDADYPEFTGDIDQHVPRSSDSAVMPATDQQTLIDCLDHMPALPLVINMETAEGAILANYLHFTLAEFRASVEAMA